MFLVSSVFGLLRWLFQVIKPSVVGGFENSALLAQWAQQHGKMAVISSTFESGLGLSAYIHLSCYLEMKNMETSKLMNKKMGPPVAHGLGTYRWLKEDVTTTPLRISCNPRSGFVEASVANANKLLQPFQINCHIILGEYTGEEVRRYQLPVDLNGISYCIKVLEIGEISHVSKTYTLLSICFVFIFYVFVYVCVWCVTHLHSFLTICFLCWKHDKECIGWWRTYSLNNYLCMHACTSS